MKQANHPLPPGGRPSADSPLKIVENCIHHLLESSTEMFPEQVALIQDETRLTYREVNDRANRFAHALLRRGIRPGDRVALLMENSPEYVISYYGTLKTGAVIAPMNTDFKAGSLRESLLKLTPRILVFSTRFERVLHKIDLTGFGLEFLVGKDPKLVWSANGCALLDWGELLETGSKENPAVPVEPEAMACILLTSGSMGSRKGVMLSHRNIVSNTHAICRYLELTREDIQMVVLPFFYVMGKSLLNTHFAVGGTLVINNRFAFPAKMLEQMVAEGVTGFSGVPSTYAFLLHRSPLATYRDKLTTLRYCTQAGGHMTRSIKEELRRVLPDHTKLYIMYGATEAAARLTFLEPDRFHEKIDSIGRAIPGVTLQLLNKEGGKTPQGEVGDLVASGPNIMMGYWKDPDSTARVLDARGYHTGDLAYEDEEGFYFLVGRRDNLVKVGGHRINTQEVENVLMDTDLLLETVVLGVPDPLLGNRLVALAASKTGEACETQLMKHCADALPRYKIPGVILFQPGLPKNTAGKTDRTQCLDLVREALSS